MIFSLDSIKKRSLLCFSLKIALKLLYLLIQCLKGLFKLYFNDAQRLLLRKLKLSINEIFLPQNVILGNAILQFLLKFIKLFLLNRFLFYAKFECFDCNEFLIENRNLFLKLRYGVFQFNLFLLINKKVTQMRFN